MRPSLSVQSPDHPGTTFAAKTNRGRNNPPRRKVPIRAATTPDLSRSAATLAMVPRLVAQRAMRRRISGPLDARAGDVLCVSGPGLNGLIRAREPSGPRWFSHRRGLWTMKSGPVRERANPYRPVHVIAAYTLYSCLHPSAHQIPRSARCCCAISSPARSLSSASETRPQLICWPDTITWRATSCPLSTAARSTRTTTSRCCSSAPSTRFASRWPTKPSCASSARHSIRL